MVLFKFPIQLVVMFLLHLFFFFFWCVGCSLLCAGFLQLRRAGATLACGAQASHCSGFSCYGAQALGMWALVVVACGLSSCGSRAQLLCGTWDLPRPGLEPCPLHWQVDPQPLRHQGSPYSSLDQKSKNGLPRLKPRCWQIAFLSGGSGEESVSLLNQAVSRILSIALIGLRSLFLCWLSAEGSSQLVEAACNFWLMASSSIFGEQWNFESI